ncbi:MAG: CusA/CzcA family heavy metal efflux RND transporter [bacterium]|nr:CusA/CzcA family heavy metal efflux RND transporter [bacterium]
MLESLVRFSIQNRIIVLMLALFAIGGAIYQATQLPVDAVPDITNKQVVINVMAPGLSAQEVERQITFPVELGLAGLPYLRETRSVSLSGLSQVTVVFDDRVDIYFARQLVNERLQQIQSSLPPGMRAELGPVSTGLGELAHIEIRHPALSLMEKSTLADWVVRPQLLTVPGLAEVTRWGGETLQFQVEVDPRKLQSYGLTLRDVLEAVESNNQNAGGAYITRGGQQAVVRGVGQISGLDDLKQVVITAYKGAPITLSQIANITEAPAVRYGAFTQQGEGEQVYVLSLMLLGENGRVVVQRVKDKLLGIEKSLPAGTKLIAHLDRSKLVNGTLWTVLRNLTEGALLVIVLLFLFLLQARAGLIVSSMIPLSMMVAILGMRAFGVSANLMSLGAIDFGLIVDGAVIIVENTVRRLSHAHRAAGNLTREQVEHLIHQSTVEVLRPALFGVFIIMAAYLPVLTLSGIEGKMFRPMALTVIFALAGAMLLAVTVIPALCSQFLKPQEERHNPVLDRLASFYVRALCWHIRQRAFTLGVAIVFVIICFGLFRHLGSVFVPELDEGNVAITAAFPPDTSLEEMVRLISRLEQHLKRQFPNEIETIFTRIGRPEAATDPMLVSQADIMVELKPRPKWTQARTKPELIEQMAQEVSKMPGISPTFTQPIKMRMDEMLEGVGVRADLAVKIFGTDLNELERIGRQVEEEIRKVPGTADVALEVTEGLPQLQITLQRERLARYGIHAQDVMDIVETALAGKVGTTIVTGARQVDVVVRLQEAYRQTPDMIAQILVPTPDGGRVPLSQIADVSIVESPVRITRENGYRRVVVQANARGRDLGTMTEEVQQRLQRLRLPVGYWIEYGGAYEHLVTGRTRLSIVVPATFATIFLLLVLALGNIRYPLMVFTAIPFALTGGILSLWLRGMPFSMSAGVGFIALGGIAVLNGLVMIDAIHRNRKEGMACLDAVIEGARARMRPVLMTASVASFGFLPMALSQGMGAEVQRPLATVVIGGVITSTLLTLVVLPTLYAWIEQWMEAREARAIPTGAVASERILS